MKHFFRSILFACFFYTSTYSQTHVIHGLVRDSVTGETLIGANIIAQGTNLYSVSNTYGFYSITAKPGNYTITCSFIGYKPVSFVQTFSSDTLINIQLAPDIQHIQEVVVKGGYSTMNSTATSKKTIEIKRVKAITSITGEPDILKSLQLLPGVQTANEGSANFNVRGGSFDQNLILLDEAPVYNPSHALGFFSTFNPDAIKNVSFYKGYFPAQFGGRLSSVVDISMKDGNSKKFCANGGIGLLASRLSLEGPIGSKASFIVSGRYGYPGQTLNLLAGKVGNKALHLYSLRNFNDKNEINFHDLNAKLNYQLNENNRFFLSIYTGGDHFYSFALNSNNSLDWGNFTSTARWNHVFSKRFFANYSLYHSNYSYSYFINNDLQNYDWQSRIRETGFKADHSVYANRNTFKFGINAVSRSFEPGKIEPHTSESLIKSFSLDTKYNYEVSFYVEDEIKLTDALSINLGARQTMFLDLGPSTVYNYNSDKTVIYDSTDYKKNSIVKTYYGTEPRVSACYLINRSNSVKISYSHVYQYLHLLSNSSVGLPTDTWLPADKHIKPQASNQFVLGYYTSFKDEKFVVSVENYYKTLENIIDFKDNADLFLNKHVETEILQGKGHSFGTEILVEKKAGNLNGWVSYSLSKTQYKIEGVNSNAYYSPRYDIRHNLSVIAQYNLNKKWSASSTFKLTSGGFITIPEGSFTYNHVSFPYYKGRNGYKLPLYHRLDLSVSYKSPKNDNRKFKSEWVLGIYNIYNHQNIYALFVRHNDENFTKTEAYSMYLFGAVPTITYNFNF